MPNLPVEQPAAPVEMPPAPTSGLFVGTGRRKTAVARVRLTPGEGPMLINDRPADKYFHEPQEQAAVNEPLAATNTAGRFQIRITVTGGGHAGQAGAVRMGLARALLKADVRYEAALRDKGLLTRDSRVVERKKYGQRKARRRFQFSKR